MLTVGQKVEKLGTDYSAGRTGEVVELNDLKKRARVRWTKEKNGGPMRSGSKILTNGLRTWCAYKTLKIIN